MALVHMRTVRSSEQLAMLWPEGETATPKMVPCSYSSGLCPHWKKKKVEKAAHIVP